MDLTIPSHSIKTFANACQALNKIGKELMIEFSPAEGLYLRSINDAKSSYSCFRFAPSFFTSSSAVHGTPSQNYMCRVMTKHLTNLLKPRRGIRSLRICSNESENNDSTERGSDELRLQQLIFEFKCEYNNRIIHRIMVSSIDNSVTALAERDNCSVIKASPKTLGKILDPVKRTVEIAMTVDDANKVIKISSFHHSETSSSHSETAMIGAHTFLKTEVVVQQDDLQGYNWKDDRDIVDNDNHEQDMPETVNEEVHLVFSLKEVKSFLQFCQQTNNDDSNRITISFEWGGRPIIFDMGTDTWRAELIMATLDHKVIERTSLMKNSNSNKEPTQQQRTSGTATVGEGSVRT